MYIVTAIIWITNKHTRYCRLLCPFSGICRCASCGVVQYI